MIGSIDPVIFRVSPLRSRSVSEIARVLTQLIILAQALGKDGKGEEKVSVAAASRERSSCSRYSEETLGSDVHLPSLNDRFLSVEQNPGKLKKHEDSVTIPPFPVEDVRSSDNPVAVRSGQGVEVSAENLWEAFLSTRPSLSSEDRARYDSAYRKFRGGSRPADFNPVSSIDDGTLRTALK